VYLRLVKFIVQFQWQCRIQIDGSIELHLERTTDVENDVCAVWIVKVQLLQTLASLVIEERADTRVEELLVRQQIAEK